MDKRENAGSRLTPAPEKARANRYDFLTGLPNLSYFFELAERWRQTLLDEGREPALLYIDLNGMKRYNHKYGFSEGDRLLRSFSGLLSEIFQAECCCHISADRFAAFTDEDGLEARLDRLFREWLEMNVNRHLPVYVGVYPHRIEGVSVGMAYDRAKIACDALRGSHSSAYNIFSAELNEGLVRRQHILECFDRALAEKWIQVYYQPIVRAVNNAVCDKEALARWIDPEKGFLSPAEFIPYLEEAGLIYRLDLFVLDQVLEHIRALKAAGQFIVPHSINLSRSDFDACDIVEEIRRRVDEAGVARDQISIEITESVIGSDFAFMKAQVERFQALGFPVWMDDFGSGYSSLDVLQSIRFDLIKFDMSFMRKLDESDSGRIILSELIKMAIALNIDTICEGVETEEQVRFLQENGCSKLQGYYFSKPVPFSESFDWQRSPNLSGYENPKESGYYETICGVNLYDLSVIAHEEAASLQNAYNTLPMGIIEIKGNCTRFVRSNQSYRDFFKRFFGMDISHLGPDFVPYDAAFMYNVVKTCCERGYRAFYDEKMPDGSTVHSFARRISTNPVTGNVAIAVAVLSITEPDQGESYSDIARALAADYYNIYVVDLETDRYIEYSSPVGGQVMAMERHGEDFFASSLENANRIYEPDRATFYAAFSKENIVRALDSQGVFTATYRLVDTGTPIYMYMKVTRLQQGGSRIIIGISNIDAQMREKRRFEKLERERAALVRVMALTDGYLSLYTVDPATGHYIEFTSSDDYAALGTPRMGDDFFTQSLENIHRVLHPDDLAAFEEAFSREKVMTRIAEEGRFSLRYRIIINGAVTPVSLRIALFTEEAEARLLVSVRAWRKRQEIHGDCEGITIE